MKRAIWMLALALLLTRSPTAAAEDAAITGLGTFTCAEFAKLYRQNPQNTELFFYSWAQGYMSALNATMLDQKGANVDLSKMSMSSQEFELRAYCDENPLKPYFLAVEILYRKIKSGD